MPEVISLWGNKENFTVGSNVTRSKRFLDTALGEGHKEFSQPF